MGFGGCVQKIHLHSFRRDPGIRPGPVAKVCSRRPSLPMEQQAESDRRRSQFWSIAPADGDDLVDKHGDHAGDVAALAPCGTRACRMMTWTRAGIKPGVVVRRRISRNTDMGERPCNEVVQG